MTTTATTATTTTYHVHPNITLITLTDLDNLLPLSNPTASSPTTTLFLPSEEPVPTQKEARCGTRATHYTTKNGCQMV